MNEYRPGISKEVIQTRSGTNLARLDSIYILEGDILLTEEQVRYFEMPDSRSAILNEAKYTWPQGIVYYDYIVGTAPGRFSQFEKMRQAMNHYHQLTGVEFRPVTFINSGVFYLDDAKRHANIVQPDYIRFIDSDGNWSHMGEQVVSKS